MQSGQSGVRLLEALARDFLMQHLAHELCIGGPLHRLLSLIWYLTSAGAWPLLPEPSPGCLFFVDPYIRGHRSLGP